MKRIGEIKSIYSELLVKLLGYFIVNNESRIQLINKTTIERQASTYSKIINLPYSVVSGGRRTTTTYNVYHFATINICCISLLSSTININFYHEE